MATEGSSSSTSAADSSEKQETMKKACELLAQGKRNVVCGEVPKAISLFDEAVQMLAKEYGDLSKNCVDAYFSYGSALLELGRMETNVLGVALEGVDVDAKEDEAESDQFEKPPTEGGEEREKLRSEVYDAMAEGEREKQMAVADKGNTNDSGEMEVDDTKANPSSQNNTETKDSKKETEGLDTVDKGSESKDKASEKESKKPIIDDDDKNGRSDKSEQPKQDESKPEKMEDKESEQDESKNNKMDTEISKSNEDDKIGDKEKTDCEDDNEKEKTEDIEDQLKSKSKEDESQEKGEKAKDKEETSEDKDPKTKESPAKILAEVNQQKAGEENQSSKEVSKEIVSAEEKENLPTDKDANPEDKEKEGKNNGTDTDVEMAESNIDKEGEEEEEVEDDDEETPEGEEEKVEGEGDNQEGAESQEDGEEKDEDVPNFQLAWEYLDLAKVIYLKSDNKEDQLKAAECHIKLGEVSMETEQHSTAAEDLESALKIQQKHLAPEDRVIAETHYQLGLAYGLGKEFELSIQHYQQAISVIEAKIASLNKLVEENEKDAENKENRENDDLQKYKDEIKELQELIPEMTDKIEDTKTEAKDMEKMKEMAKEMLGLSGTTKGFGSPTKKAEMGSGSDSGNVDENGEKKASDISCLVRKKRKPEDEVPAESGADVKKIKQDDGAAVTTSLSEKKSDTEITEKKIGGSEDVKVNGTSEVKANGDATEIKANGDATDAEMKLDKEITEKKIVGSEDVKVNGTSEVKANGDATEVKANGDATDAEMVASS